MRLLRFDNGILSLRKYDGDNVPPYAILSHTWGANGDEVTFRDIEDDLGKSKPGYAKILFCAEQAERDDLKDFWVDTCCINKGSDAELSESINSMFRWYRRAAKCYVYLQDVSKLKRDASGLECDWKVAFRRSRWFTRGWTLQELIAPKVVEFWSRDGHFLGSKDTLQRIIAEVTDLPMVALSGAPLSSFTVNERLRWATRRETTRKEDKAYCLLGIFGIFLPLIYGEHDHAFKRLRQEIERPSTDDSDIATASTNRRQDMLESLKFTQMETRHSTIKDAQRTTCEWIVQHPSYQAWDNCQSRASDGAILWIVGKPGAGKSTLMKFALAQAQKKKTDDDVILAFFFNARGHDLEKTTAGMYRSLLVQLFSAVPDLQCLLDHVAISHTDSSPSPQWTLDLLQNLLSNAVRKLDARRVEIFVDALDECNEQQVLGMIRYFQELQEVTSCNHSRVRILFASRHYPTLQVDYGWRLVLEDEDGHTEDLRKYIHRRLEAGKGKFVSEVEAQVLEKANGVFMWAVLVVPILNEEFRRGRIFAVKQRLKEVPKGLSDLFKDLLRRDRVHMDCLLLCLQWILFAKRPLSREEYYHAMVTGMHHDHDDDDTGSSPQPCDPEVVTPEVMDRFLLNSSKGLAEVTRTKKNPTVQFIHESVRDFLLKDGGLRDLWPELEEHFVSLSHERLKKCCLLHLNVDMSNFLGPDQALPKASTEEAKALRRHVSESHPFHEYASRGVLHHANEAACGKNQEIFLAEFPLRKWVHANNIHQIHDIRRHSPHTSLLYVLAEEDCFRLIDTLGCHYKWLRTEGRYTFPVITAFAHGNRRALQSLLRDQSAGFPEAIVKDPGFGKYSQVRPHQNVFQWAVEKENWSLAEYLLVSNANERMFSTGMRTRGSNRNVALDSACAAGQENIVRLLLDAGVGTFARGSRGNALVAASYVGHEKIVRMLLATNVDINYPYDSSTGYGTPLHHAASGGHVDIVSLLIRAGANVNMWGKIHAGCEYGTALTEASAKGHVAVVQVLLCAGATWDPLAPWEVRKAPTEAGSDHGHEEIVQLLSKAGAIVNAHGSQSDGRLAASCEGHQEVIDPTSCSGESWEDPMLPECITPVSAVENAFPTTR